MARADEVLRWMQKDRGAMQFHVKSYVIAVLKSTNGFLGNELEMGSATESY
jgi:hypothetical protein